MKVQRYLQIGSAMCPAVDSGSWVSAFDYDALASKLEQYKDLCAALYQMAGLVGAPVRFLDALHDAASGEILVNPIDALLPTTIEEYTDPRGCVTASYNEEGCIVAVTRQDEEGKILSVIAETHTEWKSATHYTIHEVVVHPGNLPWMPSPDYPVDPSPNHPGAQFHIETNVADLQKCQRYYLDPAFKEQVEAHTHIGSNFDEVLKEDGILEEVTAKAQARVEALNKGLYLGKTICYSVPTEKGDRWVLGSVPGREWEFFSDAVAWGNANGYLVEMESSLPKEHRDDAAD
jgi:hypothetical protein